MCHPRPVCVGVEGNFIVVAAGCFLPGETFGTLGFDF